MPPRAPVSTQKQTEKPRKPRTRRELVTQTEYARRRGVTQQAVSLAVKTGRIPTVNGKIDPKEADRAWARNTDLSTPRNSVIGDPKAKRSPGERAAVRSYAESRAIREKALATMATLDLEGARLDLGERAHRLADVESVRAAGFERGRLTRDGLYRMIEIYSPRFAAEPDPEVIRRTWRTEADRLLAELAKPIELKRNGNGNGSGRVSD